MCRAPSPSGSRLREACMVVRTWLGKGLTNKRSDFKHIIWCNYLMLPIICI
jgi:hypothetical protein